MSDASALIRQLMAQREQWVDVAPGKSVRFRRPLEGELDALFSATPDGRRAFRVQLSDVCRHAIDWRGFTEEDLLGKGIGNVDPLPFDGEIFRLAVGDNLDWLQSCVTGLSDLIVSRLEARANARGNSSPTSTQPPAPTVESST